MATETMLATADRLAEVIAAENAALKNRDWDRLRHLADDKREAVQAYERALQGLGDPQELTARARQHLDEASQRLAGLAEENERRLTSLMFAQRRVMAAISDAVVAAGRGAITYGRSGGMHRGRAALAPLAMSINGAF